MADLADIEAAFVSAISAAIYPNGTSSPSAAMLPNGQPINCRIAAGWPLPETLDPDMAAGTPPGSRSVVNISVHAQTGMEKNTTRYERVWYSQTTNACTMTATLSGLTITIGGTVTAGHYITIHLGNVAVSYAALASDTTATIAAALQALIAAQMSGSSVTGSVITAPAVMGGRITVRTAAPGTAAMELERSNQRFAVTIWAPNNACRTAVARVIRPALAAIDFFSLPDGYAGELKYESSTDIDRSGKQNLMCRDIFYWVEYPTTESVVAYPITTFVTETEIDTILTKIEPLPLSSFTPARIIIS